MGRKFKYIVPLIFALFLEQCAGEDFQYKHVVLGVVLAPETIPVSNVQNSDADLKELILKAVNSTPSSGQMTQHSSNSSGEYSATNITRTANVTVIFFDLDDGMDGVAEISILLSLVGCAESHELNKRMTKIFGPIVHIAFTEPGCPRLDRGSALTVPLTWFQYNADLLQLFTDVRSDRVLPKWKDAVVIYDVQSRPGILDTFVASFSSHLDFDDIALSLFKVDSMSSFYSFSEQIEEVLDKYRGSAPTKFIVVSEFRKINFVLVTAKRRKMLNVMKQWLFVASDTIDDEDKWDFVRNSIITDGVNIAFITNSSKNFTDRPDHLICHTDALLSLLTDVIEELASWEFNLFLQVSDEEWEIIKPSRADRVMNITQTMTERLSNFVLSKCDKNSSTWNLEAGEYGTKGKRVFEVGWWNPVTGLVMTDDLFPHVTGGFRGRKILVASMHFPPWQIITKNDPKNPHNVSYSGLMLEVVEHMGKNLNFTFNVVEPPPGETWGVIQSDGRWNGMMRLVIENPNVVIGAAAFTVTPERARYVNFTEVLEREAYAFMVNRPAELSRVLLFAEPFSIEVWICIIVAVIVVAPVLNIIHCLSYYYKYYDKVNDRGLFKLKNCYWYIYGAILQQGGTHLPDAISGRLIVGFWWLFVLVSVTTYSGSLVAFLTFPKIENPVNSIDDVLNHRGVSSWGFMAGSVIEDHLKRSNDPKMRELYEKALIHPAFNESVLHDIKYNDHAYIDWKITLMTVMRDAYKLTKFCDYILGEETIFEEKIALAVPRGSPYLPLFNQEIKEMSQTGLIKKWKSRYWPQKDKCSTTSGIVGSESERTVKLGDMQGSFYLLFMGFFIATTVLAGEFFIFRRRKKRMIGSIPVVVSADSKAKAVFWNPKKLEETNEPKPTKPKPKPKQKEKEKLKPIKPKPKTEFEYLQ